MACSPATDGPAASTCANVPQTERASSDRSRRSARDRFAHFGFVVLHLAARENASRHRFTLLGWMWPLARQVAQLAVLVFMFSKVIPLHVHNFTAFVFAGLIAWTWFSSGVSAATTSLLSYRHLVFQPRVPLAVVPAVAVAVPLLDVVMALPVLFIIVASSGDLSLTILFLPVVLAIQFVLTCGIAWIVAAGYVYLRDLQNLVVLALLLLFYLTPVFYDRARVPGRYEWLLLANPMTTLTEAFRTVTIDGVLPSGLRLGLVGASSVVVAFVGYWLFKRLQPGFVDEL